MPTLVEDRRAAPADFMKCTWEKLERTYRCCAILCPEEDGGYSVFVERLPGVVSQGETESEALSNIAEAFQGAVSVYLEDGAIPWQDAGSSDLPDGSIERWIVVNVA